MPDLITQYPQFFTATCLEWKYLLASDQYKDIIISSLRFLVNEKRIILYGFVIMQNHIHLIWQMRKAHVLKNVQRDFLKYTSQQIKKDLAIHQRGKLPLYKVKAKDRTYQFWERNPLSVDLWTDKVAQQKLRYIHENPVRKKLCNYPEEYLYSSAAFYHSGIDNWGFLSHLNG